MMWQEKGTGWKEWFEITGADGVDFVPYDFNPNLPNNIIESHTKEEMLEQRVAYPRSNYVFWKWVNNYKCYLVMTNQMKC